MSGYEQVYLEVDGGARGLCGGLAGEGLSGPRQRLMAESLARATPQGAGASPPPPGSVPPPRPAQPPGGSPSPHARARAPEARPQGNRWLGSVCMWLCLALSVGLSLPPQPLVRLPSALPPE